MGAKKTSELIPFCHPLSLEDCHIDIRFDDDLNRPNEVGREGGREGGREDSTFL
jgi:molybdenum cofactor biosynthesis enzyme